MEVQQCDFQTLCVRRKKLYQLCNYQVSNPWLGFPGAPYIVVPRVTTVIWGYMTYATLQIGQGDNALPPLTFSLIALDGTHRACTLYFFDCDLTIVAARTVLSTVVVGKPPLCTLLSSASPMPGKVVGGMTPGKVKRLERYKQ
jgi:hypothetical protein